MKTEQRSAISKTEFDSKLVFWIALPEAEQRFDVQREELIRRVRQGQLEARRILCDADLVVAVSSRELERDYKPRRAGSAPAPAREKESDLSRSFQEQLQVERVARARLEGELASSDKIERSMQRYADRLEQELSESRKQAMTLARALGRAERLAAPAARQLADPARRSWWKLWG